MTQGSEKATVRVEVFAQLPAELAQQWAQHALKKPNARTCVPQLRPRPLPPVRMTLTCWSGVYMGEPL